MRGQIGVADETAIGPAPGVELTGDRAAIEFVGDQAQAALAIARRLFLGVFSVAKNRRTTNDLTSF